MGPPRNEAWLTCVVPAPARSHALLPPAVVQPQHPRDLSCRIGIGAEVSQVEKLFYATGSRNSLSLSYFLTRMHTHTLTLTHTHTNVSLCSCDTDTDTLKYGQFASRKYKQHSGFEFHWDESECTNAQMFLTCPSSINKMVKVFSFSSLISSNYCLASP